MGALTFVAASYSHFVAGKGSKLGMWVFLLNAMMTAAVFHLSPETPIADSFPNIGKDATRVSLVLARVVGSLALACALTTCPPPMGNAMAMTVLACQMVYDLKIVGVSPPVPAMVLCSVAFVLNWVAVASEPTAVKKNTD